MKIEICFNTLMAALALSLAAIIIACTAIGCYYGTAKARAAFAAGLQEVNDTRESTHYGK